MSLFEWMQFLPTLCQQHHSLTLRNHTLNFLELRKKKLLMLAPSAHSWVWLGMVPLVTSASFRQQINSCVWPSNQTHTIKVMTKIILSSAGPMSHACPVWPHPHPLAHYVILCIHVFIIYYHYYYRIFGCGGSSPILVNMSMWTRNQGEQAASHKQRRHNNNIKVSQEEDQ